MWVTFASFVKAPFLLLSLALSSIVKEESARLRRKKAYKAQDTVPRPDRSQQAWSPLGNPWVLTRARLINSSILSSQDMKLMGEGEGTPNSGSKFEIGTKKA